MARFVLRDGQLVPKHLAPPLRAPRPSHLPRPVVISDGMAPLQSMADGRWYESKSAMRAATRAAGCEEVGNDTAPLFERPITTRPDVRASIEQATALHGL